VPEDAFTELKPTALVVELRGKAAPQGKDICVAFRADMDALSMTE
jgi:metal-dependent amidase/aminoacylase/carboxypeptidase family protein